MPHPLIVLAAEDLLYVLVGVAVVVWLVLSRPGKLQLAA